MRISRLELLNWKNFRHVDVSLPYRVFLIGPNASGKSNFLDALRFLRDIADREGGFQKACADREGVSKMRCLAARQDPQIGIAVELAEDEDVLWRYEIRFNQQVRGYRYPLLTHESVYKNGELILARPDKDDLEDGLRLTQTALEQINYNQAFRDIALFFNKIAYLRVVPQQMIRSGGDPAGRNPLAEAYGQRFLERVAEVPERSRSARLRRIRDALIITVPQLQDLRLEIEQGQPHLVAVYEHWRATAARQNEAQFSEGMLRLIGLLWALQEGEATLLLDEPDLSLHAGIVQRLPGLFRRVQKARKKAPRQIFIGTHSAALLSDPGIGGDEIFLLRPVTEGTRVRVASSIPEISAQLEAGATPADVVIPYTEPEQVDQLDFLDLL